MEATDLYVRKMNRKRTHKNISWGKPSKSFNVIWEVVSEVPIGKVTTYGDVARLCGLPGQARLVGYALHHLPENMKIPWHRVINSQGRISFPPSSSYNRIQRKLLKAEGIRFDGDRVMLMKYQWLRDSMINYGSTQ
jgi:methylated-DNA-protein-cysteine methyltransferase related protein